MFRYVSDLLFAFLFVHKLSYMCMNVEVNKQKGNKVILCLGKDICQCY